MRIRELIRLAWPTVLSYILNNSYRINDQFWIQGLGEKAQTAVGASFFVLLLNFSFIFLAVSGTLAFVARAVGARDDERRDRVARHGLLLGLGIGLITTFFVRGWTGRIVTWIGLSGDAATLGDDYLGTLFLFAVPLALFPVLDGILIGRGHTRVPMLMQCLAVVLNYILNPILIYGEHAAEQFSAPGVATLSRWAGELGIEGRGIAGAALATGIARTSGLVLGLAILRFSLGTRLLGRGRPDGGLLRSIIRTGVPSSVSIAVYSLVYWILLALVISKLGDEVTAALGVGFQVFEGMAFPCFLGISMGAASLVGRALGARDPDEAWGVVRSARRLGRVVGIAFALIFFFGGDALVPYFSRDEGVVRETMLYVKTLAFAQLFVSAEAVNERVLLGAGYTRPILWIAPLGNLLRIPLGYVLAVTLGYGAAGVWWAINLTTMLKALLFWLQVQRGRWIS